MEKGHTFWNRSPFPFMLKLFLCLGLQDSAVYTSFGSVNRDRKSGRRRIVEPLCFGSIQYATNLLRRFISCLDVLAGQQTVNSIIKFTQIRYSKDMYRENGIFN